MGVADPGRACLLDERPEGALVAGHGAGVRGGRLRAGAGFTHLQHRDADSALGAERERLGQPGAVAVLLEE